MSPGERPDHKTKTGRNSWRTEVGCQETFPGSDYTDDEREFLIAIDRYKCSRHRPHPSWREVLQVLRALGWRKLPPGPAGAGDPRPQGKD
jgi:hypothetical protein